MQGAAVAVQWFDFVRSAQYVEVAAADGDVPVERGWGNAVRIAGDGEGEAFGRFPDVHGFDEHEAALEFRVPHAADPLTRQRRFDGLGEAHSVEESVQRLANGGDANDLLPHDFGGCVDDDGGADGR